MSTTALSALPFNTTALDWYKKFSEQIIRDMESVTGINRILYSLPRQSGKSWLSESFTWTIQEPNVMYPNHRGTYDEHMKARADISEFQNAMRRQDSKYYTHKQQVDAYLRNHNCFHGVPFREWLKIIQNAWTVILQREQPHDGSIFQSYFGTVHSMVGSSPTAAEIDKSIETSLKGKAMKPKKEPKKTYNTCAVRFMRGDNLAKCYTYRVPKKVKLHLGEEIVVPSWDRNTGLVSNGIAVVVELHPTPADTDVTIEYRFITGRVQKVK